MDSENPKSVNLSRYYGAPAVLASILRDVAGSQGWLLSDNYGSNGIQEFTDGQMCYFPKDLKSKSHKKNGFVEARQFLLSQVASSVQKYHSEPLTHCLKESDCDPSQYVAVECFTKHQNPLMRAYLPNIPSFVTDIALMSALDDRVDMIQNDLFLLRHIGNSVYDHMRNMARMKPQPDDCADETDLSIKLPEIFGLDYNKKPF